jgi:hypothetical protein
MGGKRRPRVVAPKRQGFGTSLLKATFTDVRIDYSVEGLTCEIDLLLGHAEPGACKNLTLFATAGAEVWSWHKVGEFPARTDKMTQRSCSRMKWCRT